MIMVILGTPYLIITNRTNCPSNPTKGKATKSLPTPSQTTAVAATKNPIRKQPNEDRTSGEAKARQPSRA